MSKVTSFEIRRKSCLQTWKCWHDYLRSCKIEKAIIFLVSGEARNRFPWYIAASTENIAGSSEKYWNIASTRKTPKLSLERNKILPQSRSSPVSGSRHLILKETNRISIYAPLPGARYERVYVNVLQFAIHSIRLHVRHTLKDAKCMQIDNWYSTTPWRGSTLTVSPLAFICSWKILR